MRAAATAAEPMSPNAPLQGVLRRLRVTVAAWTLALAASTLLPVTAAGQPVYPTTPNWVSADTKVSTGAALVDINGDGWLDFVVANGNDMARQRLVVYYNRGDGSFPPRPDWQSADIDYNAHLDVADVNGDGWPDVAVADCGSLSSVGPAAKLYLNHAGTLSPLPDWISALVANAFTVAFGDVNNDGRPDLAVATGWVYDNIDAFPGVVHLNVGGELERTPSWQSSEKRDTVGVLWIDADRDGWLDLLYTGARHETCLYRNLGGTLETAPSWQSADNAGQFAIMATAGDVNADGLRDLFVADNKQLGARGGFRQYDGLPAHLFAAKASWKRLGGYGSAVALADLDGDGALDLAFGGWWTHARLVFNTGAGLAKSPGWTSKPSSVIEKIVLGDIDKNGLRPVVETFPLASNSPRLFSLRHQPIQEIVRVTRGGVDLGPNQCTFSREHAWVTIAPNTSAAGDRSSAEVVIEYTCSSRLDMAVTTWDSNLGNFVYFNQLVLKGDANCDGCLNNDDIRPFALLIGDPATYHGTWPDCNAGTFCDMNGDGVVNRADIPGFVAALRGE